VQVKNELRQKIQKKFNFLSHHHPMSALSAIGPKDELRPVQLQDTPYVQDDRHQFFLPPDNQF
jgi:hypothetical protein